MRRTNYTAARNLSRNEGRSTQVRRGDSNEGNQPQENTRTRTKLTEIEEAPPPPRSSFSSSSSLLILHCPSRAATIASTLPSPLHTTATVIQCLTRVSAGPTKTTPSTLQGNRREKCTPPAATAQHRSDLLRISRRHQHCDKQSTVKYECNGRVNTSG